MDEGRPRDKESAIRNDLLELRIFVDRSFEIDKRLMQPGKDQETGREEDEGSVVKSIDPRLPSSIFVNL